MKTSKRKPDWIKLPQDYYAAGRIMGVAQKRWIKSRINTLNEACRASGFPSCQYAERVADLRSIMNCWVPHWLEEAKGMASGADVLESDILRLNCVPGGLFEDAGMNCSSFVAVNEKQNMLFKIRDERDWVQFFRVQPSATGFCQISVDVGNLGAAHIVNSRGLAGGNNTGGHCYTVSDRVGLNDCHLLRYFSESCNDFRAIEQGCASLLDAGVVGGASIGRGMIFLFVDTSGGMILECSSDDYCVHYVNDGVYTATNHFQLDGSSGWGTMPVEKNSRIRKKRIQELVERSRQNPGINDVFRMSRDRKSLPHSLCNDNSKHFWTTVSSALHVIDRSSNKQSCQFYCCGNTRDSVMMPISLVERHSNIHLLSGGFYTATLKAKLSASVRRDYERAMIDSVVNIIPDHKWVDRACEIVMTPSESV